MFLLRAIQQKFTTLDGESAAFVFFNVKGRDLMAIDEPNIDLTDNDKSIYQELGLNPTPFDNVKYYYPYSKDKRSCNCQTYALANDIKKQKELGKAYQYKFTFDKCQDKLDLLLANEDDSTGTLESCVKKVI